MNSSRRVGAAIQRQLRDCDLLARLGGDEFGLLLPNCSLEEAVQLAERMRLCVESLRFRSEGRTFSVNASIGVVHHDPSLQSPTDVLRAADRALLRRQGSRPQSRPRLQQGRS